MKKIALLGSTGSIGRQVLQVVDRYPDRFQVVSLCCNSNARLLSEQINKYKPMVAGITQPQSAADIPSLNGGTLLYTGPLAIEHCIIEQADIVFVAVVGFCGLSAVLTALSMGKDVALANKEALVAGGGLVTSLAKKNGCNIIPVDSEHSALWQALAFDKQRPFKRLILTASGGAFRDKTPEQLENVTAADALKHPNWNMGAKITVDCATMVNKGLEVMEAMWLYDCGIDKISVLLHYESVVHSMVEYADNAVIAQLGVPSMLIPIQLALTYPERLETGVESYDFTRAPITFKAVEKGRYPCFDLAMEVAKKGGVLPCALSGANEAAVQLFLEGKIKYGQIYDCLEHALSKTVQCEANYENLFCADANARMAVAQKFGKRSL